jgi:ribosomal protein S27AE
MSFKFLNADKTCSACGASKQDQLREHRNWWEKLLFKARYRCAKCNLVQYVKQTR